MDYPGVYCISYFGFEMFLADSKFELPKMKKGGNKKQTPAMGVAALILFPQTLKFPQEPMGGIQ